MFGCLKDIAYLCVGNHHKKLQAMKKLLLILLLMPLLVACQKNTVDSKMSTLYQTLDSLIECHDDLVAAKQAEITSLRRGLQGVKLTEEQEYDLNLRLYNEYLAFRFDSAYYYINRCMQSQLATTDPDRRAISAIHMAHILSVSGIFNNARLLLDDIRLDQVSTETRMAYYNQRAELNLYRSEMAQYTPYFTQYIDSAQYFRQLLLQIAPKESFEYITNRASYTCEKGNVKEAIRQYEQYLPTLQSGDRRYSIIASTLAYFYWKDCMPQQQEYYLILSSISDLKAAILENNALRELATILMERGQYKQAYRYLTRATNDAREYGSRLRSMQVARMSPLITKAYDAEREHTQQRTSLLLTFVIVIAVLLAGSIVFTLWLLDKRRVANRKIKQMNTQLSAINAQLSTLNSQMKEGNRIKEEYIGRFLELCSALIHRGEERHKHLNRLARDRKLEDLYAELKSSASINEGIKQFHKNFDTAFLNIYPNFISEVNKLMTEENRFEANDETSKLTTELRVLALIRLGISDNQNIADILRSSIATIYTYRSKLKAKALSKDTFEDDIRQISTY